MRANRGEGIKLASLAFNKLGLIFQSCHNGVGSEVTIIYQPSRERFGRLRYRFKDPDTREIWEDEVNNISDDIVHPRGLSRRDWTRVIFLGNRPDHNTVIDLYDQNQREPYARFTELLRRYYEIVSPIGMVIELSVDIRSGLRAGARFETISRIAALATVSDTNTFRYEAVKDDRTGIEVIYMDFRKYTPRKQNVIGVRYLGSQTMFGGIVWRNELHDVRKDWPLVARQFGLQGVTGEMCVFVRLPDVYPVRHDRYRLDLLDDTNEPLRLVQFSSLIERRSSPRSAGNFGGGGRL